MTSPVYIILLLYYIRQFHVAVGLFSNISQKIQNVERTSFSDTLTLAWCATFFVHTTFRRHVSFITEQTHGNIYARNFRPLYGSLAFYRLSRLANSHLKAPEMKLDQNTIW